MVKIPQFLEFTPDCIVLLAVRLIQDAADWVEVHGDTPWTNLPGFDPWRIYPDVLHVLDLAVTPDSIASFLLFATDNARNRDAALGEIRRKYFKWASEIGLDSGYLANPKLFSSKTLRASTSVYPSISQKFLKGAAARMMSYLCVAWHATLPFNLGLCWTSVYTDNSLSHHLKPKKTIFL